MWLRKTRLVPGSAPGGYEWNKPDDSVEVPDDLALELVEIPGAGFEEVPAPAAAKSSRAAADSAEVTEAPTRRRGPRKTTTSDTTEVAE
ncbi:hypothetical protein [Streptomyces noursei]|uniref:hypothetical protein n=1 Tax=Streptomyces noursei TaxID=1971 RepID=UPI00167BF267|nr:hypothetical protein [Streptomyces noursei]MCZ1013948.1 hypothetical protein [Streptomyces noursei]GGX40655.1 hypothetical protein GCM10010341_73250 [Streptomyces noursei]